MEKIVSRVIPVAIAIVIIGALEVTFPRPKGSVPQPVQAYEPTQTTTPTETQPAVVPTIEPVPVPVPPASTPCPSQDATVAEHMKSCTNHEAPYSHRETISVYQTNNGTYDNPDWGYCKPGTLGCIAGNQGKWNVHKNLNGSFYSDQTGFFFVENECAGVEPIDCPVYWPIDQGGN